MFDLGGPQWLAWLDRSARLRSAVMSPFDTDARLHIVQPVRITNRPPLHKGGRNTQRYEGTSESTTNEGPNRS